MATQVEICSNALMMLGDAPIASLSETTKRAKLCVNLYPIARRDILRRHNWNCCVKRVVLAPLVDAPVYGWGYQFTKPGDFLRLIDVGDVGEEDFAFEGNRILANISSLKLRYVADITEGSWDANLTALMVKRMEMDLAYPVTKSTSLRDSLKEDFYRKGTGVLAQAKAIDGQENPPEQLGDSPFIQVRGG